MRIHTKVVFDLASGRLLEDEYFDYDGPLALAKGTKKQLESNSGKGVYHSEQLNKNADNVFNYLDPALQSEASNPQGYTPTQMASANTALQQSAGGGASATTGQANLEAARTRNSGGFQGAIGTANRNAQKDLSQNALKVQMAQADLQQQQKQQALQALQSLYGMDLQTALGYLNSSNSALGQAGQQSMEAWKNLTSLGTAAISGASSAGSAEISHCWIAAAVFDEDFATGEKTQMVREWLNTEFVKRPLGRAVMAVYRRIGKQVAWLVRRSSLLRAVFKPLFEHALAEAWLAKVRE